MRPLSKAIGVTAFLLVEAAALFGSYVVASVRCCQSATAVGPADAGEWAALVIFAIVMIVPAAMIAAGVAMIVEVIGYGGRALAARLRGRG